VVTKRTAKFCECGCGAGVRHRFVLGHSAVAREYPPRVIGVVRCAVADCERLVFARGWCAAHYKRWQKWGDPRGGRPETIEARFRAKVRKGEPHECWLWIAATNDDGYGIFRWPSAGRMIGAHRAAWMLEHGEIANDLQVLHRCDNPPCVNVAHLFLGTQVDNILDMCHKGRHVKAYQKQRR